MKSSGRGGALLPFVGCSRLSSVCWVLYVRSGIWVPFPRQHPGWPLFIAMHIFFFFFGERVEAPPGSAAAVLAQCLAMRAGRTRVEERAILPVGRSEQTGTCSLRCTGRCTWLVAGAVGAVAQRSACSVGGTETGEYLVVAAHRPRRVELLGRPGLDFGVVQLSSVAVGFPSGVGEGLQGVLVYRCFSALDWAVQSGVFVGGVATIGGRPTLVANCQVLGRA
ncbi:hypothetical protein NDU88_002256 [Pleurodeles waltl]|uniref:Uncharacterized protein n=1 Tax=Pleurodeles waltl TaxID=8319 RepID=A0AAV7P9G6_PLEWA|nr:hypothetical protein NDU88_002256 [Pleurodeles waltl]